LRVEKPEILLGGRLYLKLTLMEACWMAKIMDELFSEEEYIHTDIYKQPLLANFDAFAAFNLVE
jgi:hypothetical protein